jgi:hypothetical protein
MRYLAATRCRTHPFVKLGENPRRHRTEGRARKDGAEFEPQIGAAVPRQTELHDLPPEVAEAMNGYWDDQYVLVRDTMVIVDRNSRRIQFHALQQSTCEEISLPSQVIVGRPGRLYTAIATFFHGWSVRATKK